MKQLLDAYASITAQIAQLERSKDALMAQIIEQIGHDIVGQKTYDVDGEKVTVTTKETFSLDKARLAVGYPDWMPVNTSTAYTLRTKEYQAIMEYGTSEQKSLLADVVTVKPAKPSIKVQS